MKYDIEFIITVSFRNQYLQRIKDFIDVGIINICHNKVLVNFLVGQEVVPDDVFKNLPYDFNIIKSDYDHVATKLADFYLNLKEFNSRWFVKVDDDSINDVGGLLANLDKEFDWEKEYNLINNPRTDIHAVEIQILKEMGLKKDNLMHELECNIMSQVALKNTLKNTSSIELIKKRREINEGYSDQFITIAARLAKIHPIGMWFTTQLPDIDGLSFFGGHLNHIHDICIDKSPKKINLLKNLLSQNKNPLSDRDFAFYMNKEPLGILRLHRSGKIKHYNHPNECFWQLDNKDLIIFDRNAVETATYKNILENMDGCFGVNHTNMKSEFFFKAIDHKLDIKKNNHIIF